MINSRTGLEMDMAIAILRVQEGLDFADFFESRLSESIDI
jgi:hypothetical protein